jgi:hypothetical protein
MPSMDEGELTRLIESTAAETRQNFDVTAEQTRQHVDVTAEQTRRHVDVTAEETRRHFDVIADEMKREVHVVAEGFVQLGARLDLESRELREEMNRGFIETQAMIKFA